MTENRVTWAPWVTTPRDRDEWLISCQDEIRDEINPQDSAGQDRKVIPYPHRDGDRNRPLILREEIPFECWFWDHRTTEELSGCWSLFSARVSAIFAAIEGAFRLFFESCGIFFHTTVNYICICCDEAIEEEVSDNEVQGEPSPRFAPLSGSDDSSNSSVLEELSLDDRRSALEAQWTGFVLSCMAIWDPNWAKEEAIGMGVGVEYGRHRFGTPYAGVHQGGCMCRLTVTDYWHGN